MSVKDDLITTLEDVLQILNRDGQHRYGETPEDADFITYESTTINAIEDDIVSMLDAARGAGNE